VTRLVGVVSDPLDASALEAMVADAAHGAVCTFQGIVRGTSQGRRVQHLVYEAYAEMAEAALGDIVAGVAERWPGAVAAIRHRVGRLEIGEASVVIAVASPHRAEAFEACRWAIDALKAKAPIWKKEVWADGEEWVEGTRPGPVQGG